MGATIDDVPTLGFFPDWCNNASYNVTIDMCFNDGHVISIVLYSILFVFSAIGNITVLSIILRRRRKSTSRINTMLMHLAIADLIVTFLMMPLEIMWAATVSWLLGDIACRITAFFRIFGLYLSSFVLICISIDRYFAVLKPMNLSDVDRRGKVMLTSAWLGSVLCSSPQCGSKGVHCPIFWSASSQNTSMYKGASPFGRTWMCTRSGVILRAATFYYNTEEQILDRVSQEPEISCRDLEGDINGENIWETKVMLKRHLSFYYSFTHHSHRSGSEKVEAVFTRNAVAWIFHVESHPNVTWYEQCVHFNFFPSPSHELAYFFFGMIMMYGLPLLVIIFSYASILAEIYRRSQEPGDYM
ncbi:hypothetical protein J6590_029697 [Homalodisca vitripennis]|nr:hypothetical protein J6590_029697 [Homalodisca vitripennis]